MHGERLTIYAFFVVKRQLTYFKINIHILLLVIPIYRTCIELLSIQNPYLAENLLKFTNNWLKICKYALSLLPPQVIVVPQGKENLY
jgi:hypothetical protein